MTDLQRSARRRTQDPQNTPRPAGEPDLVVVDTTWGELQPLHPVEGVRTVGELELVELVEAGAVLVDSRVPDSRSGQSLPGAVNVPHDAVEGALERGRVAVLFCNGPQCPQTPDALRTLVAGGHPVEQLAYYRGGMHDWLTLGFPVEPVEP